MNRPDLDEYFLAMAVFVSVRGTCLRRRVGCVLVDRHKHVLATGYAGVPMGFPHCNDMRMQFDGKHRQAPEPPNFEPYYPNACPGATAPSGQGLDQCRSTHAEANALLQCGDTQTIDTCYTTASPCIHCVKLLLNTSCRRVIFRDTYPHTEPVELWKQAKRIWLKMGPSACVAAISAAIDAPSTVSKP